MIKLLVFDIDGTLAAFGQAIDQNIIDDLNHFANEGITVCLSSGKPAAYIAGLCRQANLTDVIIIGENGASIYFGSEFPPKRELKLYDDKMLNITKDLKLKIKSYFDSEVWLQPNEINVTCFYRQSDPKQIEELNRRIIKECLENELHEELECFKHKDSIEFVYKSLNKGNSLIELLEELDLTPLDVIAIGDSENDYPMFKTAGRSIGINLQRQDLTTFSCSNISQAMEIIRSLVE